MKNSFKYRIEELGLSYKREIITFSIICFALIGLTVGIYIVLKEILVLGIGAILLFAFSFFYFNRYSTMEKKIEKEHVDELISLLSYFEIYISNKNNVYTSFRLLLPYSSKFMEDAINSLLLQIDEDKTVQPFTVFASKFDNRIIESLMLSIYQMVDNGENQRQFDEFNSLFTTVSRDFHISLIENKKSSLESMNSWPLFGAAAIIIILTLCILSVVGDMVNVI